jgi:hypothetical protein
VDLFTFIVNDILFAAGFLINRSLDTIGEQHVGNDRIGQNSFSWFERGLQRKNE